MANVQIKDYMDADGSLVTNPSVPGPGDTYTLRVGALATDAQHGIRGGGTQHPAVTVSANGFMTVAQKAALELATADIATHETRLDVLDALEGFGTFQLWNSAKRTGAQHAKSDLFPGSSLDVKWTDYDATAIQTEAVASGRVRLTRASGAGITGIFESLSGLGTSYSVSARLRITGYALSTFATWGAGLCLTDGVVGTSDMAGIAASIATSAHYQAMNFVTSANLSTVPASGAFSAMGVRGSILLRIRVTTSTAAIYEWSGDEGQNWSKLHSATAGFTPTHLGLYCWNASAETMYFDFSEVYVVDGAHAPTDQVGGFETLRKAA